MRRNGWCSVPGAYARPNGGHFTVADGGHVLRRRPARPRPRRLRPLRSYVEAHNATATVPLRLLSQARFVEKVFFAAGYDGRARVIGFNLPFDISRIAVDVTDGRGRNRGGFSFILSVGNRDKGFKERRHRPRVQVKHSTSTRAFIRFAKPMQADDHWDGEFVDLRTLTFALTGRGHSLASACEAFGAAGKLDPGSHGTMTSGYIDYCRGDVAATLRVYEAGSRDGSTGSTPDSRRIAPTVLPRSPKRSSDAWASPRSYNASRLPSGVIGYAMSTFYGGRAECRIRHVDVPVTLVDFTSSYPTTFALLDLHRYLIAADIRVVDATARSCNAACQGRAGSTVRPRTVARPGAFVELRPGRGHPADPRRLRPVQARLQHRRQPSDQRPVDVVRAPRRRRVRSPHRPRAAGPPRATPTANRHHIGASTPRRCPAVARLTRPRTRIRGSLWSNTANASATT